jgi:hypothetical protein
MSDLTIHTPAQNAQLDPMTVAKVFRASGMFPDIQSEAAACAKLIIGRGLGLADYDAMSGLHIIKGKAVLAANLMAAAIKRSGKYDYRSFVTEEEARIEFRQRKHDGGWETIGISSFTLEDAKRAGLGGDNWRKYPKAMLFARCISAGYKQHCPDALGAAPVYVESHGETEITEDAPPPPRKALPAPAAPTREERRADTEALLSPAPQAERAPEPPAAPAAPALQLGGTLTLVAKAWQASSVKRKNDTIYRVDVDGCDAPFAVLDRELMHSMEAANAFGDTIEVRWGLNAQGKRVITEVLDA